MDGSSIDWQGRTGLWWCEGKKIIVIFYVFLDIQMKVLNKHVGAQGKNIQLGFVSIWMFSKLGVKFDN